MPKKLKLAIPLLIVSVVILVVGVILGIDANPQEMYRHFPEDAGRRLQQIHTMQTLAYIFGGLLAVGGLIFLFVGLNEKKTNQLQ